MNTEGDRRSPGQTVPDGMTPLPRREPGRAAAGLAPADSSRGGWFGKDTEPPTVRFYLSETNLRDTPRDPIARRVIPPAEVVPLAEEPSTPSSDLLEEQKRAAEEKARSERKAWGNIVDSLVDTVVDRSSILGAVLHQAKNIAFTPEGIGAIYANSLERDLELTAMRHIDHRVRETAREELGYREAGRERDRNYVEFIDSDDPILLKRKTLMEKQGGAIGVLVVRPVIARFSQKTKSGMIRSTRTTELTFPNVSDLPASVQAPQIAFREGNVRNFARSFVGERFSRGTVTVSGIEDAQTASIRHDGATLTFTRDGKVTLRVTETSLRGFE